MTEDRFQGTQRLDSPVAGPSIRLPRLQIVVVDGPDRGRDAAPDRPVVRIGSHPEMDFGRLWPLMAFDVPA